jgi:hypothetical protein
VASKNQLRVGRRPPARYAMTVYYDHQFERYCLVEGEHKSGEAPPDWAGESADNRAWWTSCGHLDFDGPTLSLTRTEHLPVPSTSFKAGLGQVHEYHRTQDLPASVRVQLRQLTDLLVAGVDKLPERIYSNDIPSADDGVRVYMVWGVYNQHSCLERCEVVSTRVGRVRNLICPSPSAWQLLKAKAEGAKFLLCAAEIFDLGDEPQVTKLHASGLPAEPTYWDAAGAPLSELPPKIEAALEKMWRQ